MASNPIEAGIYTRGHPRTVNEAHQTRHAHFETAFYGENDDETPSFGPLAEFQNHFLSWGELDRLRSKMESHDGTYACVSCLANSSVHGDTCQACLFLPPDIALNTEFLSPYATLTPFLPQNPGEESWGLDTPFCSQPVSTAGDTVCPPSEVNNVTGWRTVTHWLDEIGTVSVEAPQTRHPYFETAFHGKNDDESPNFGPLARNRSPSWGTQPKDELDRLGWNGCLEERACEPEEGDEYPPNTAFYGAAPNHVESAGANRIQFLEGETTSAPEPCRQPPIAEVVTTQESTRGLSQKQFNTAFWGEEDGAPSFGPASLFLQQTSGSNPLHGE